jgi:hypothetical protein
MPNSPVHHLALVIYQQTHMNYSSRMRVLQGTYYLGWSDLMQEVLFCLRRR